jgi:hypothetical protein
MTCQRCALLITNPHIAMMPWHCTHRLHLDCFVRTHRRDPRSRCSWCSFSLGTSNRDNVAYVAALEVTRSKVERDTGPVSQVTVRYPLSRCPTIKGPLLPSVPSPLLPAAARPSLPSAQAPPQQGGSGLSSSVAIYEGLSPEIRKRGDKSALQMDRMILAGRSWPGTTILRTHEDYQREIPNLACRHGVFDAYTIKRTCLLSRPRYYKANSTWAKMYLGWSS